MATSASDRRFDIDWLRVGATYLLLLFHVGMVFNPAPFFHIRNAESSMFFLILCGFIGLWHMPLFFLLAGWSAFASITRRGRNEFLRERSFRLFVPLVTGCVLLMPSIKYLELSSGLDANYTGLYVAPELQQGFRQIIPSGLPVADRFDETFFEFLPTFFTDLSRFTWAHLWFVAYLLIFTILYLPLFQRIRRSTDRFATDVSALWAYAPIVPLAVIQLTMRARWPGLPNLVQDWANFAYYSVYLICGFMLARFPRMEAAAHRERKRALLIAIAATLVLLLGVLGVFTSPSVLLVHTAVAGWCYVVAFLGWARQRLSHTNPTLRYLTESAFPVYLLHQAAIVVPGYFLIKLPGDLFVKFGLLLVVSTLVTLGAYHLLVRPFSPPRFLCGMKTDWPRLTTRLAVGATSGAIVLGVLAVRTGAAPAATPADAPATPIGRWHAEGGAAQVELADCEGTLCGRVVWLRSPYDADGCLLRDTHNPDESLRNRPVVGLEILHGLKRASPSTWDSGTIYDPASGNSYRATLRIDGRNRLALRGYIGIPLIGRTTTWFRVGAESEVCAARG